MLVFQTLTETEAATVDVSDCRFQVQFIFGEQRAFVLEVPMKRGKFLSFPNPATEENFEHYFECIFKVLVQLGECRSDEKVLCTTFPAGTKWVSPQADVITIDRK